MQLRIRGSVPAPWPEAMEIVRERWIRITGRRNTARRCANMWRGGCPMPRSLTRSMRGLGPIIPAMPRWDAASAWAWWGPSVRKEGRRPRRKPGHHVRPKFVSPARADRVLPAPAPERAEPVKLRCVGITPRLLSLIELEPGDCRYPYGGDKESEAIAFCGHPRLAGSSYCAPHFHLTRGPGTQSERAVAPVVLRLVEAA